MTEPENDSDSSGGITPRGQKLPQCNLAVIRPIVAAARGCAGPASKKLIAKEAGLDASGGAFRAKFASARYLGFIAKAGQQHEITPLGEGFLDGDELATQQGVMRTGFGPIIERFATGHPRVHLIAGVLNEEHGVPEKSSEKMARLLIEIAGEANLIEDDRFDAAAIEQALESTTDVTVSGPADELSHSHGEGTRIEDPAAAKPKTVRPTRGGDVRPFVEVHVHVDGANLSGEEIRSLINAIGANSISQS